MGTKVDVGYYHFVNCEECKGKGIEPNTKIEICSECDGSGQKVYRHGFISYAQTCPKCSGEGFTIPNPCQECNGQTRVQKYDKFSINIPKGVFDNAELRIADKGDAGIFGGPSGDLYVKVSVTPDKKFKRVGDNLESNIMLTYPQLALGAQVEIENIDESKETIKIPKGCPVGEKISIPKKGFFNLRSKNYGNFVIITQCHIPKKLSPVAKNLLKEYSDEVGTDVKDQGNSILGFFKKFLG